MIDVLYKFASRSRPEKFFTAIDNIYINSRNENFYILATLDTDDATMNNEDVISKFKNYDKLYPIFGNSKNKIDAINRDMELAPDYKVLINMSDDMLFVKQGYDEDIINDFANDFDRLLHYNDGNQRDNVCTMSIMGKEYYDRFKYIYHPDYTSLWCDCEATDVAKILGKYKYMGDDKILFRHIHPSFGLTNYDEQYKKTESHEVRSKDQMVYINRRDKNFYLSL